MTTNFNAGDLEDCFQKLAAVLFSNEREIEVIYYRADDEPLTDIGKMFGVSRERIRQIELKAVRIFAEHQLQVEKIIHCLRELNGKKSILKLNEVTNFLDEDDAKIIFFLADRADLNYTDFQFDKKLNAFIFNVGDELDEDEISKSLPTLMLDKAFETAVKNLAQEKNSAVEVVRAKLLEIYKQAGKAFYRGMLSFTLKCKFILKEYFPDGYKIGDKAYYSRFMSVIQEVFDDKTIYTQRNVDAKIGIVGVLCARGKHIHPDFVHVPQEIVSLVKDFIDNSERTAIFYKEIFEALKEHFVGTQITNHYFLQGVIKLYKLPYTLRKDYLTKSDEINMANEFTKFVAERGEVSLKDVKAHFISFKSVNINFLLPRCPEVIRINDGVFVHTSQLNLQEEDFKTIKKFLKENCSTPVNSRVLFKLFSKQFADFMARNKIQNHGRLFGILRYMFRDDFNFSRPYIASTDFKDVNHKKVLLQLLDGKDKITIKELSTIFEENGFNYTRQKSYLYDILHPEFIYVDEDTLGRVESIGITNEVISAVVKSIQSAIERNGGWQTAQAFDDYANLPQLKISWNSFLLESVASLSEHAPCKLKSPHTPKAFSPAIFVSEEFAEDDFQSFMLKVLIAEHTKQPVRDEEEIFNYLKAQGLCKA